MPGCPAVRDRSCLSPDQPPLLGETASHGPAKSLKGVEIVRWRTAGTGLEPLAGSLPMDHAKS
jgi:hypothetical protein